jgi:cation:H+ antiporter
VGAALSGQADVALGNVVGSNIFNILFILGVSALITPLVVSRQLVRLDVPIMIAVSLLALLLALDGHVGRVDGLLLVAGIITYTVFLIRSSRRETAAAQTADNGTTAAAHHSEPPRARRASWPLNVALIVAGVVLLVLGARWFVDAAVLTAERLGLSKLVIGLTIVAAGTSLPEVATSVLASIRGERDIAVGNVVGSNIFNILAVLGLGSVLAPSGVAVAPGALTFDIPVMIATALACLPVFFTGYTIARWEGLLFLAYYAVYTIVLILRATEHHAVPALRMAIGLFVLPLTAITLIALALRAKRRMKET